MATTTNYGFTVPTSADLVKNGATAISTLGSNLDTFLFRPFSRNGVLNSNFSVWQRGTSFTAATAYTADRWYKDTNTGRTVSRQATGDTTNLPNIQYCLRYQRDSGNALTTALNLTQSMETVNSIPFAGKQVTFSFYARAGANFSSASSALNYYLVSGTGTDQNQRSGYTGQALPISTTATLTTTWQRFTATATVAATATELATVFEYTPVGTASTNDYFEITGVQLEVGNQASPYAPTTPIYATELAACQRYYYRKNSEVTGGGFGIGQCFSITQANVQIPHPVTMRTTPTLARSGLSLTNVNQSRQAVSAISSNGSNVNTFAADFTTTGIIAGNATTLVGTGTSTTDYIEASAEL